MRSDSPSKNTIKDVKLAKCLVVFSHVPTLKKRSLTRINNPETAVCLFPKVAEGAAFGYISVLGLSLLPLNKASSHYLRNDVCF